jgi:SNF2 family DNA or RNA helicase
MNGKSLYPFQQYGVRWLALQRAALLADEMGLGKTVQVLLSLGRGPILVLCPAIAIGTWERESRLWRLDLLPHVQARKTFAIGKPPVLTLCSYDSLPPNLAPPQGLTLIGDEAHYLKNSRSRRAQNFRILADRTLAGGGRVILLTGTPLLNKPQELWNVLRAANLAHKAFGSWEHFVELFGGTEVPVFVKKKPDAPKGPPETRTVLKWTIASPEVRPLLGKVMLRRTRAEVLPDLPGKTYNTLTALLDPETLKACALHLSLLREGEPLDVFWARLHEEATFEVMSTLAERLAVAKIPSLLRHVESFEEQEETLVVLSMHRKPIEALARRPGWASILGGDSADSRVLKIEMLQKGVLKGLAGTLGALGTSATLTAAAHVLFVSRSWVPEVNAQAEDRLARIGQTRGVVVHDLTSSHPLDARLSEVLREKTRLVASVFGVKS